MTKLPLRAFMQRVRRNRGIYSTVKALKCSSGGFIGGRQGGGGYCDAL